MIAEDSFDDMCEIPNMTEQTVLGNLTKRYMNDQIFTFIGPTLLVVNPYRIIPELYNQEINEKIVNDAVKGSMKGYPHIYTIAGNAFRGLRNKESKQSIIISGESGAGKTESTKYCMQILTKLSKRKTHAVEKKILACNPLLEAFGNSKTVRNENSSRFGKYVQILFGRDHTIKGAKIQNYLLEKSRVVMVGQNERNFHIFYALTAKGFFGAKKAFNYTYLSRSQCYTANNINDAVIAEQVIQSFNDIGFDKSEQQKIWKLLIAILELGNLEFDDKDFQNNENKHTCKIVNPSSLGILSEFMQITEEELLSLLLKRKTGSFQNNANKLECQSKCDTLSKALYNAIFQSIIDKIEIALSPNNQQDSYEMLSSIDDYNNSFSEINLLDIFGFQNFEKNSIEQICINFANQKLLQQYNHKVFESQMTILREDGLQDQLKDIQQPSNKEIITLLTDIFKIINEKTTTKVFKESEMIPAINQKFKQHPKVEFDIRDTAVFKIKHSPCIVSYSTDGFKTKNQDELTSQINSICTKLFPNTSFLQKKGNKTILNKFSEDIEGLITKLSQSTNHFVRCIKPNERKMAKSIDRDYMATQIKYLGVFETIKIRQAIFPSRKTYEDFSRDYQQIYPQAKGKTHRQATRIILDKAEAKPSSYLFGNNRVYLSKELDEKMQKILEDFVQIRIKMATLIQRRYRASHARKLFRETVKSLIIRIRVTKFSEANERILVQLIKDRYFVGLRQIEIFSEEKKKSQLQAEIINQKPEERDMQDVNQELEVPLLVDRKQTVSTFKEKPYQFPTNEKFIEKFKNDIEGEYQDFKKALLQEKRLFEEQKKKFLAQKIEIAFIQVRENLKQKHDIIISLQSKVQEIEEEKLQQQIIFSKKITESVRALAKEEEKQLEYKRQVARKYSQLTDQNQDLKKKLEMKDQQLEQLIKARASQEELKVKLEQYEQKYVKLEQKQQRNDNEHEGEKQMMAEMEKKIKMLEKFVRDYEQVIQKYKVEKEEFFKEKDQMHRKYMDKLKIIEGLQSKPLSQRAESPKKNQEQEIIKQLKQRIIALQEQNIDLMKDSHRKSQHLLYADINRYSTQGDGSSRIPQDFGKDFKIMQLEQSLKNAEDNIVKLEANAKSLQDKIKQLRNKTLTDTAEFNNKLNHFSQKFTRDKYTIDNLNLKNKALQQQVFANKIIISKLQEEAKMKNEKSKETHISQGELLHFLKIYHQNLKRNEQEKLKEQIMNLLNK